MAQSAYFTAFQMTQNMDLLMRVAASAQQEAESLGKTFDPETFARDKKWDWATQADWITAVQAAQDTGITEWGRNAAVVTDQMILSWVQPAVAAMP